METNVLNFEILADELVQIGPTGDHVAPCNSRRAVPNLHRAAKFIENFERKKCDLAFVIILEIEVTIAANATAGRTFDHRHFDNRVRVRLAAVMADKIVSR